MSPFRGFVVVRLRSVCDGISLHLRQEKNKQVLSVLALTASIAADDESMTNASQPVGHQSIQKHNNMASEVILQNRDEKGQKSTAKPLENHVNETRRKKVRISLHFMGLRTFKTSNQFAEDTYPAFPVSLQFFQVLVEC